MTQEHPQQPEGQKPPTEAEVIAFYEKQIVLAELRCKFAKLQADTLEAEIKKVECLMVMAELEKGAPKMENPIPSDAPKEVKSE